MIEVRFPLADDRMRALGYGVVTSRAREEIGAAEDLSADFAADDVVQQWAVLSGRKSLPWARGKEGFAFELVPFDAPVNARLSGSSANLACLLEMVRRASPAIWGRRVAAAPELRAIWATGRIAKGELAETTRIARKLHAVAAIAAKEGGTHWAFVPHANVDVGEFAKDYGVAMRPHDHWDPTQSPGTPGVDVFFLHTHELVPFVRWWLEPDSARRPRWPFHALLTAGAVGGLVAWAVGRQGDAWEAAADYSSSSNPNGAWSYGWRSATAPGEKLILFSTRIRDSGVEVWTDASNPKANFWRNDGPGATFGVPEGMVTLHPGSHPQNVVLRWTAPRDFERCRFVVTLNRSDQPILKDLCTGVERPMFTSAVIKLNGEVASDEVTAARAQLAAVKETTRFDIGAAMRPGDHLDVEVGRDACDPYIGGNTPVRVEVSCDRGDVAASVR